MTKVLPILIAVLVLSFSNVVDADTIIQTETVSASNTFSETLGITTEFELVDDQFFSLTADPFDPALGNLVSFTVVFTDISVSGTGSVSENFGNGSAAVTGPFTVGGASFNGAGGTNFQQGEDAGDPLDFGISVGVSQTFFVADEGLPFGDPNLVGTAFDPAILATVTGAAPFEVLFASNGLIRLNSSEVVAEASGTISIEYHFEPAAIPEPSSAALAMFGFLAIATRRRRA